MADVERARHRRRRRVDRVHRRRGRRAVEARRCPRPPTGPTRWPRAPRGRACRGSRTPWSPGRGEPVVCSGMIGLPYPACSGSTTPPPATLAPLRLREPGRVSLYVCGPTVDGVPHLGHGRFSLVFDVLRRYLLFSGLRGHLRLQHHRHRGQDHRAGGRTGHRTVAELTAANEALWWEIMDALGVLRPDEAPHATAYVDRMVDLIADLVGRGVAYETATGVYLSVLDVPGYGLLARQPLDSLRAGARVEADEEKRSPLDFVLWKKAKPGEPTWDVTVGRGTARLAHRVRGHVPRPAGRRVRPPRRRPGPVFPHHENERAQAVADGRQFARHWMHNGWVMVGGEKMSKSLGNFTSLDRPAGPQRRPRLPPAGAAVPLPLAHRGDTGDDRRGRGRTGPTGRAGPAVRPGRPAGRRSRGRTR